MEEPPEEDNSEDSEEEKEVEGQLGKNKKKQPPTEQPPVLATLSSDPACHPFKVKGVVRGQCIICLLDTGASHNFISSQMVSRRGL